MQKTCKQCSATFEITDEDQKFYEKVNVSDPTMCPDCRAQRRMAFRNERNLYHRKCDLSGKQIISIYSPDKPYEVYETSEWWSDKWDPFQYGRDFNFDRPFFDQFGELLRDIPHLSIMNVNCENCDYTSYSYSNNNCYMTIATDLSEDCYYLDYSFSCKDCVDCMGLNECNYCYSCLDCVNCYKSFYCQNCYNCSDIFFSSFCRNCKNCFGCVGLRNKEYHIYNKPVSKKEWEEKVENLILTPEVIQYSKKRSKEEKLKYPHPLGVFINCENCTGDYLSNSKNSFDCYDGKEMEDCKYCTLTPVETKDCYDVSGGGRELLYECYSTGIGQNNRFCGLCWNDIYDLTYCIFCMNASNNLFGCIGLKKKQYCILNKQYSKDEYEKLVPKIIEHMKSTGEWAEFFPVELSPFSYNETAAQEVEME
jgi:hypothetical protein